jgi:hypothetical protein
MAMAYSLFDAARKHLGGLTAGLALAMLLFMAYAVAGYYLVPEWVRTQLLPQLSRSLNADLSAERVSFDPFGWTATVQGFALKDRNGRELASWRELSVDVDVVRSFTLWRLVAAVRLVEPVLRPELDGEGRLNFQALLPAGKDSAGGGVPFFIEEFIFERGRIEFRDASRGQAYTAVLDPVDLSLQNLSSAPDAKARFRLTAKGEKGENLAAQGSFSLAPLVADVQADIAGLDAATWLGRFATDSPWRLKAGALSGRLGFRVRPGRAVEFDSQDVSAEGLELASAAEGGPWIKLGSIGLDGLAFSPADRTVKLAKLNLQAPETSWGKAGSLALEGAHFDPATQSLTLAKASLQQPESQWGKAAVLSMENLAYDPAAQRLTLGTATVQQPESRWGKVLEASATGLALDLKAQRLTVNAGALQQATSEYGSLSSLALQKLAYDLVLQRLDLGEADGKDIASAWLKIGSATGGGLLYEFEPQHLQLAFARVQDVAALGPMGPADSSSAAITDPPPKRTRRRGAASAAETATKADAAAAANQDRYKPRRARIGDLQVAGVEASLKTRFASIDSLVSDHGEADIRRLPGGNFRVRGLPPPLLTAGEPARSPSPGHGNSRKIARRGASEPSAWDVTLTSLKLADYSLGFRDETAHPIVRLNFGPGFLKASDCGTRHRTLCKFYLKFPVGESGTLEVDGQGRRSPLEIDLRFGMDQLWLRSLQPYWHDLAGFDLKRGKLNLWGDITVRQEEAFKLDYSGGADIVGLEAVDRRRGDPLMSWKSLKFEGLVVHTDPRRFAVRSLTAEQPFFRVIREADGRLNLARDLVRASRQSSRSAAKGGDAVKMVIGLLRSKAGSLQFADLTMNPGFATDVQDLNGTMSGLSSDPQSLANLLFEGRISGNSPARIYGTVSPFNLRNNADVSLEFKGLNLTTLSAYAGKFAGYRIEKGKLDVYLRYKLKDNVLEADNRVVLDQLDLGEKVDNDKGGWPVELAIKLLKDRDGRIDFELPISGSLTNPQFSLGSLYANAFGQFFAKLVTSPMALVGSLAGGGGDEGLAFVKFLPGQKSFAGDEKDKLVKVAKLLKSRPGMALNIKGAAAPEQDRLALAEQALMKRLTEARRAELRAKGQRVRSSDTLELSDEDYRRLFADYYRQRHPESVLLPEPEGNRDPGLYGLPFQTAKQRVLEKWDISETELRLLAQDRGESIRSYLVQKEAVPDQRIYLLDVKLEQPGEKEIRAFLSLSGS